MLNTLLKKIVGSRNDRILKDLRKKVAAINALEPTMKALSDEALQAKTAEFKERLQEGISLDSILVEAFAVVREASVRTLGMRHFDVQLIGGMVLHSGSIAEMRTGEGKTLVATLPLYLHALKGEGAHLVTVNEYLAKRDAEEMGKIYSFLGLTVGVIVPNIDPEARRTAYAADITYGTNNEFGFDYLRDNMVLNIAERVQRGLKFAVVDEVDSILIDEARTPLIISGIMEDSSEMYIQLNKLAPKLKRAETEEAPGDYFLDEKSKQAHLTEEGHEHLEQLLVETKILQEGESLYSPKNLTLMHYFNAVLRANTLYQRDVDYIIQNGEIVIIDPHTGRAMTGRRWSEGLHQAVEAKENVKIQAENQTLASITFQNYFRMYETLSGMTGTADTEAYELQQIYDLEVVIIPTNRPMVRHDEADVVFLTAAEKFNAMIEDIQECQKRGQPVLVGTASIETSEQLSGLLKKAKVKHEVLNAKQHEREAKIVAEAGRPGAVTIATNMAGRGTDIILGGNLKVEMAELETNDAKAVQALEQDWQKRHEAVKGAAGLRIIGSERHESRRIDNQLRGRSGRQGDPGSSRFYLSLEDHLIRIFSGDRLSSMMRKVGMGQGEALQSKLITRAVANAQKKVEGHNFDIRKQLLEYDNVVNNQRQVIYDQRTELLTEENLTEILEHMRNDVMTEVVERFVPPESLFEQWDLDGLHATLQADFMLDLPFEEWIKENSNINDEFILGKVCEAAHHAYREKTKVAESGALANYERMVILNNLDSHWREHLSRLDHLRNSIGLRGYAQKDPKQEYKREAFNLFADLLDHFKYAVISILAKLVIKTQEEVQAEQAGLNAPAAQALSFQHQELNGLGEPESSNVQQQEGTEQSMPRVGRNDPCPCGSGKKFKYCHGKVV